MAQKNIAGIYHVSSGNPEGGNTFAIFDDHRFLVAFFGGVIVGTWNYKDHQINFKPFTNDHKFYVYGRHNASLKDSTRFFFQGFEHQPTFVGFDGKQPTKPLLKSVFNTDANCVPFPSVATFDGCLAQILLSDLPGIHDHQTGQHDVYRFINPGKYNDFVAVYHQDDHDKGPFAATLRDGMLFVDGEEKGAARRPLPTEGEDFEFFKPVLNAPESVDKVFYSPSYQESAEDLQDKNNWRFDESKGAYINFLNYVEGEENRLTEQDANNRPNIVYQFNLLELAEKKPVPFDIDTKPLFTRTCD